MNSKLGIGSTRGGLLLQFGSVNRMTARLAAAFAGLAYLEYRPPRGTTHPRR